MMELNEKIQELRKGKEMTQEELAQVLHVSRTAVSKWESGRGFPSIDSLKAIAAFFAVSIDDLLSDAEVLAAAGENRSQKEGRFRDLVFGLMDLSVVLFGFLPVFGHRAEGIIRTGTLLSLAETALYLRLAYFAAAGGMIGMGILTLALQKADSAFWRQYKRALSIALNAAAVLVFVACLQPYAAVWLFVLLAGKMMMLFRRP